MKQISFFVSSTFKDMQGERDALHRIVMPEIKEFAKEYGREVDFVDLRWGISTENLESEKSADKILKVCLDEIDECAPYQIIILGERYGWIPSISQIKESAKEKNLEIEKEISITELEILYGMWKNQENLDKCIFCMRKPFDFAQLKEEDRKIYIAENEEDRNRMEVMKERIRNTPGACVIEYSVDMKREKGRYNEFTDKIVKRIRSILENEWGKNQEKSWIEKEFEEEQFMTEQLLHHFYGREESVNEFIERLEKTRMTISMSKEGIGVSSMMAKIGDEIRKKGICAVNIYCGNGYCWNTEQLIKIMCAHLEGTEKEEEYGRIEPAMETDSYWKEKWDNLASSYQGERILFFIDGIHHLEVDKAREHGFFLPGKGCSNEIQFVITTDGYTRVYPIAVEKTGKWCDFFSIKECNASELKNIIQAKMKRAHKDISENVMKELLAHPLISNMVCLEMILQDILIMDHEDFEKIQKLEETMDGNTAIDTYLCKLIRSHPHSEEKLIEYWFLRMLNILAERDSEEYYRLFYMMIGLMLSVNGVTYDDMMQISQFILERFPHYKDIKYFQNWEENRFVRLRRYMGRLLHKTMDGRYRFAHSQIRSFLYKYEGATPLSGGTMAYYESLPDSSVLKQENLIPSFLMYIRKRGEEEIRNNWDKYCFSFIERMIEMTKSEDKDTALEGKQALNRMIDGLRIGLLNNIDAKTAAFANSMFRMIKMKAEEGKLTLDYKELAFFIDNFAGRMNSNNEYEKSILLSSYISLALGYEKWLTADEKYKKPELKKRGSEIGRFKEWTTLQRRTFIYGYTRACELFHELRTYINNKEYVFMPEWDWKTLRDKCGFYLNVLANNVDIIRDDYCTKIRLMDSDNLLLKNPMLVMDFLKEAKRFIKQLMVTKYEKGRDGTKFVIRCYVNQMTEIARQYVVLARVIEDIYSNPNYGYLYGDGDRVCEKMLKNLKKKKYIDSYLDLEKLQILKYCVTYHEIKFYRFEKFRQDYVDSMWELQKNMRADTDVMNRDDTMEEVEKGAVLLMEMLLQGYVPQQYQGEASKKQDYINTLLINEGPYMLAKSVESTLPKAVYYWYLLQALFMVDEKRKSVAGWDDNLISRSIKDIENFLVKNENEEGTYVYKLKWLLEWLKKKEEEIVRKEVEK